MSCVLGGREQGLRNPSLRCYGVLWRVKLTLGAMVDEYLAGILFKNGSCHKLQLPYTQKELIRHSHHRSIADVLSHVNTYLESTFTL